MAGYTVNGSSKNPSVNTLIVLGRLVGNFVGQTVCRQTVLVGEMFLSIFVNEVSNFKPRSFYRENNLQVEGNCFFLGEIVFFGKCNTKHCCTNVVCLRRVK